MVGTGGKRGMAEERRIGRKTKRKAVLAGHIGRVPNIRRKCRGGTWSVAVLAPF